MASVESLVREGAQLCMEDDNGYRHPRETFEVLDPPLVNEIPRNLRETLWRRWFGSGRKQRFDTYEDEGDTLLYGTNASNTKGGYVKTDSPCGYWCIYGGNTVLSILLFLIILNLLFGFATFLQLPGRPDPFSEWGKPGTTSEGLVWYPTDFLRDVTPIPCHSHNDYWRKVPLFSALYNGCISIETDVWAFNDELYVGHNTASLTANRTFQSLYINPLVEILARQNPNTSFYNRSSNGVFDTDAEQTLTLLVDVKTDGEKTWPLVLRQLEPLRQRDWLSYMENDVVHHGPVTVVGTGETPFNILTLNQTYRNAFFDAPLNQMWDDARLNEGEPFQPDVGNIGDANRASHANKLTSKPIIPKLSHPFSSARGLQLGQGNSGTSPIDSYTPLNSYYASASFSEVIGTIWWGKLSNEQVDIIRGQIRGAHHRGLKARYWDLPSWPTSLRNYIWDVLVQEGVDVLNVDNLEAVRGVW